MTDESFQVEHRVAMTPATAVEMKSRVATAKAEAMLDIASAEEMYAAAKAEFEAQRKSLEAEFRARMSALETTLKPLRQEMERLGEILWTVDLYLGRDEEVKLLQDGTSASADEPITIRQCVLAADEESLLVLDKDEPFDYQDMDSFLDWLVASAENRDRIAPDAKSVVVVVPTFRQDRMGPQENKRAHWILRNGERLYVLTTDEKLSVGRHIVPARNAFDRYFYDTHGQSGERRPLEPGSTAWLEAEKRADAERRHYMRLMLILQGLVDRSPVFHPLPAGGVNLMSVAAQDLGHVRIVNETDLILSDGRPSFKEWQRSLNAKIRPGVRVVLGPGLHEHRMDHGGGNYRITPSQAKLPPTGEPLMVSRVDGGDFVIPYDRQEKVFVRRKIKGDWLGRTEQVYDDAKNRASCRVVASDDFVLPFDLASLDDLKYYMRLRSVRESYPRTIPIIKAAILAKEAELEQEAPLRALLIEQIAQTYPEFDRDLAEAEVSELITWWKIGHKFARSLAGDEETEAKAAVGVMREWTRRNAVRISASQGTDALVAAAKEQGDVLFVGHVRGKRYFAYLAADLRYGPWVHELTFSKSGELLESKMWTKPTSRTMAAATAIWEDPRWSSWDRYFDIGMHITEPEERRVVDLLLAKARSLGKIPVLVTGELSAWDDNVFTYACWATTEQLLTSSDPDGDADMVEPIVQLFRRDRGEIVSASNRYARNPQWGRYSVREKDGHWWEDVAPERPYSESQARAVGQGAFMAWEAPELQVVLQRKHAIWTAARAESAQSSEIRRRARTHVYDEWIPALKAKAEERFFQQSRQRFDEEFARADVSASELEKMWDFHKKTLQNPASTTPGRLGDKAIHAAGEGTLWGRTFEDVQGENFKPTSSDTPFLGLGAIENPAKPAEES